MTTATVPNIRGRIGQVLVERLQGPQCMYYCLKSVCSTHYSISMEPKTAGSFSMLT